MGITKIGIVGAGAIGLLVGEPLTRKYGRERVFYIVDEKRGKRYGEQGFRINGKPFYPTVKTPVSASGEECCDLLLVAVKAGQLSDAIDESRPFVGPGTIIVSLMNGISSEREIAENLGLQPLLLAVAQGMDATKVGNELVYQNAGNFSIGEPDNSQSERLALVRQCLEAAGIRTNTPADMPRHLWSKFMLNCGVNQVLAVHKATYDMVQHDQAVREEVITTMKEVLIVASAEGVSLSEEDITGWLGVLDSLGPDGMPSMAQDILAGRKTEKALFSGTVKKLGKKYGISTPVNDRLYEQLTELEQQGTGK